MALAEFLAELDTLQAAAASVFAAAADDDALEQARIEFLGAKSGRLKAVQKQLGAVPSPDKPAAGKRFNEVKTAIEALLVAAHQRVAAGAAAGSSEPFDPTLPGPRPRLGHLHPLTQTIEELKDIMGRLGFTVATGPEIEDERHNFEALNIPASHPAAIRWRTSIWPRPTPSAVRSCCAAKRARCRFASWRARRRRCA